MLFGQSSIEDYVLNNIGYDFSSPILGPYGIPIPGTGARLQIHVYVSGNFDECCKNGKKVKYARGTIGAEAYLTWGLGTSRRIKGRDRNKPDPNWPGSKKKDHETNPQDSGCRSRSLHVDATFPKTKCPEAGLHFQVFRVRFSSEEVLGTERIFKLMFKKNFGREWICLRGGLHLSVGPWEFGGRP